MATLSGQVTATGFVYPSYADTLAQLQAFYQGIYGSDVVLTPDTQDGQWIAIMAQAIFDTNSMAASVFASFSPTYAQGTQLSSLVKINGIQRDVPTNSEVVLTLTGVAGTLIANGLVGDDANLGTVWALPPSVTIGDGGTVTATATCTTQGATTAAANSLTVILTPTLNWQSVTNGLNTPSTGNPVEPDPVLRQRQSVSTSLPATGPLDTIQAAIENIAGVADALVYNNPTSSTDGNGIPSHSISAVVNGGDVNAVAQAIFDKKSEGTGTYGSTSITVVDQKGVPNLINFYEVAFTTIYVDITVTPLQGYSATIGNMIVAAILEYINGLPIGGTVSARSLSAAACLFGTPSGQTFDIAALTLGTTPSPVGTTNVAIAFNAQARSIAANVALTS